MFNQSIQSTRSLGENTSIVLLIAPGVTDKRLINALCQDGHLIFPLQMSFEMLLCSRHWIPHYAFTIQHRETPSDVMYLLNPRSKY